MLLSKKKAFWFSVLASSPLRLYYTVTVPLIICPVCSMMDHYYDKLLQIAVFDSRVVKNPYLTQEAAKGTEK